MELDPNDRHARSNQAIALWRLGDALRAHDPTGALASYDDAAAILRSLTIKSFSREVSLVAVLSESTFALRALGRSGEIGPRLKEALDICEAHRTKMTPVYGTCSEFTSRAQAAVATAEGRRFDAVKAYREWLAGAESEMGMDEVRHDLYSAWVLVRHYRLTRDAMLAAGMKVEAAGAERKLRETVAMWRPKLIGRNDADVLLGP
jgi:hypothetical protein